MTFVLFFDKEEGKLLFFLAVGNMEDNLFALLSDKEEVQRLVFFPWKRGDQCSLTWL